MAQPPEVEVNVIGELREWKPPRYRWKCIECFGADLPAELNRIDSEEWGIFQVIPSQRSSVSYVVIARKPIEEEPAEC